MDIAEAKRRLRRDALRRRRCLAGARDWAAAGLAEHLLPRLLGDDTAVTGAYWPLAEEMDPRPLIEGLAMAGGTVALPVTAGRDRPLVFRRYRPGDALETGAFGVMTPIAEAEEILPDRLLVPLLAFDSKGYRIGYGAGYYDRTIAEMRARGGGPAIGIAFAGQEVGAVPREPHDEPLDMVATERGLFEPQTESKD